MVTNSGSRDEGDKQQEPKRSKIDIDLIDALYTKQVLLPENVRLSHWADYATRQQAGLEACTQSVDGGIRGAVPR